MFHPPHADPPSVRFATRALGRLAPAEAPGVLRPEHFDPTWITLIVAVLRLLIELLDEDDPEAMPPLIREVRAPRPWQLAARRRRRKLIAEARRRLRARRGGAKGAAAIEAESPDRLLDAILDEAVQTGAEGLRDLVEEGHR